MCSSDLVQTWGESTVKNVAAEVTRLHSSPESQSLLTSAATIYLHVFNWPMNGQLVVGGLKSEVKNAELLVSKSDGKLYWPLLKTTRLNPFDISISVPADAPDKADSVVVLECDSAGSAGILPASFAATRRQDAGAPGAEIAADTNRLLQPEFPSDTLRAFDGELHGKGLKFGPGKKTDDVVMNWTKPDEFITWPVRLEKPATYDVSINYLAPADVAGGAFTVSMGSQNLSGEVKAGANQTVSLGRISLTPGKFEIKVATTKIYGGELFRLRSLELKPVASN